MIKTAFQAWCIQEPNGGLRITTFALKKVAIEELIGGTGISWKQAYKTGWRIVKVGVYKIG